MSRDRHERLGLAVRNSWVNPLCGKPSRKTFWKMSV